MPNQQSPYAPRHARRPADGNRVTHRGSPRLSGSLIRPRRWPRRLLVGANLAVAVVLIGAGSLYGYVKYKIGSIATLNAPHLEATQKNAPDSVDGLAPENILLIGNQTRAGIKPSQIAQFGNPAVLSGSLSDVIMILHVDPAKQTASILSIPRDLFVPMPQGSPVGRYQKVDAALNDGAKGPDNLIAAIENDFGIPINHFVELEFDGFENTVNALGGINIDFPEKVFDAYSGLNITQTGCLHLNGAQALALVRARHLQYDPPGLRAPVYDWPYDPLSDLSRIVRDHTFLRVLVSTAESQGLTNPVKLNNFLDAVINQIIIDPGLKSQLVKLATHYRHLNPNAIPEYTLPVTTVNSYYYDGVNIGDVDFPSQPQDRNVISEWDSSALPAPAKPSVVNIYNITNTYGLATKTSQALASLGLPIGVVGNANVPSTTTETLVRYPPGGLAQALAVANDINGAVMLDPDPSLASGTIDVDIGNVASVVAPPSSSAGSPASTSAVSSAAQPASSQSPSGTSVPTPGGETPSSAHDKLAPWDPIPCPAGVSPVN
jgi:LCP family protein required for cell wall assembly